MLLAFELMVSFRLLSGSLPEVSNAAQEHLACTLGAQNRYEMRAPGNFPAAKLSIIYRNVTCIRRVATDFNLRLHAIAPLGSQLFVRKRLDEHPAHYRPRLEANLFAVHRVVPVGERHAAR